MRIRRQAKLAGISFSNAGAGSGDLSPHLRICHLNQSPWDAISFPPDSASSPYQFDGEDSFTANMSFGDSLGAVESVESMKLCLEGDENNVNEEADMEEKDSLSVVDEGNDQLLLGAAETATVCCKTDGKGWQCKSEAARGHSLCEHHLSQLRAYNTVPHPAPSSAACKKSEKSAGSVRRHRRPKKAAPSTSATTGSNPYEFYYYSGFGPRWGKKRGAIEEAKAVDESTPSDSQIGSEEFDYVDDDDEDDVSIDGETPDRKRTRKPIKARSLKSLM
ncbi:hypothetical protein NMG60_11029024 [Bertholletia excelsa]